MVDDSKQLQENFRRMNNLERLLSQGTNEVDPKIVAEVLPPSTKYSQLLVYDLQLKKGRFWVSIAFPYVPKDKLSRIDYIRDVDRSYFGQMLGNLKMLPIDGLNESGDKTGSLEISGVFDLKDTKVTSLKEISNGGYVTEIVKGLYIDGGEQRTGTLVKVSGCPEDGFFVESKNLSEQILVDKKAQLGIINRSGKKAYSVIDGGLGVELKDYGAKLEGYLSAVDQCLDIVSGSKKITSIKAFHGGQRIDFTGLLIDMRSWYFSQLK